MRFGLFLIMSMIACSVFGQDTLLHVIEDGMLPAEEDSICEYFPQEYTAVSLLKGWRKSYPFKHLADSAYAAAKADTLLDKSKHPFSYSEVKLASDSIKALTRIARFDRDLYLGQVDYRLPIFNTGNVPSNDVASIIDRANDYSMNRWDYIEPADAKYQKMDEARKTRELAVYQYVKQHPSRYSYTRGSMALPSASAREKVSTEKSLEGKNVDVKAGVKSMGQIQGIQSQIKTDVWHRKGSSNIQMSQTALTDNWYKGGDNNMTVSTVQKLELTTFDENKKTSFDVLLELRLSALYTKTDTVNPLRVNDNLFSATVKYGYQAWKHWYYSTSLYAKTPIFDYHSANSKVIKSTFLAPLEANLSVGMEYKYNTKDKKLQYSLLLAPFAYNLKYVATDRVNETSFGIEEGKNSLHQFGTTVSSSLSWKISNDVSWNSRLYYFTSYKNIQAEFENTFNFTVSRRFTCTLYLYPRFDDSLDDKIQMKEMLAFGFNYVW